MFEKFKKDVIKEVKKSKPINEAIDNLPLPELLKMDVKLKYSFCIASLGPLLIDSEEIKAVTYGLINKKKCLVVATEKRVLFMQSKLVKNNSISIPIKQITSVTKQNKVFSGAISIQHNNERTEITKVPNYAIDDFVNSLNNIIMNN